MVLMVLMFACFALAQEYWFQAALAGSAFTYAREMYEPMKARSVGWEASKPAGFDAHL